MEQLLHDVVLRPLADAFLGVGVFVAVLVAAFGLARWRFGDRVTTVLQRHHRIAPVVGATLGVVPGCGAEIILATLYLRGSVSFGTVVASLVATTGDAAWVLIVGAPQFALQLHLLTFALGIVTGYAVDAAGLSPRTARPEPASARSGGGGSRPAAAPATAYASAPDLPASPTARAAVAALPALGTVPAAFWALALAGLAVSVPVSLRMLDTSTMTVLPAGADPYLVLGVAGSMTALAVALHSRMRLSDDTVETADEDSLRGILLHGAKETSFVVMWVAAAFIAWAALSEATGFDGTQLPMLGAAGVICGALLGLVPGCAVQILLAGLFLSGGVPAPAFVANAVSQDGDALLPLLAADRRAAMVATLVTTVPALVAGFALLLWVS